MNRVQMIDEVVHQHIIERYPMYITNAGFEQWLLAKAGNNSKQINEYLNLLDDYGYMQGDGTLANDYVHLPDPEHVISDIGVRLSRLEPEVCNALQYASIEGDHFSSRIVAALAKLPVNQVSMLLEPAANAGLIVRDGSEELYSVLSDRYRFIPLQTRMVIYRQLSDDDRLRMHTEFIDCLSRELEQADDEGTRNMLGQMISQHNKQVARPASDDT